eukprot:CAMPEP_0179490880 /NCGR_PEP_ID=MMETSP0799-20121207/65738_1 /TAXON_ID=46947 /ORGANISM="Geminigera cryophila, Strain CCMP2564" /LENGTH=88 /DNA_ID=CAMNT_0021307189 /DNA_START=482 /DNA_END=748 /DNA_ORIENTATION=-
MATLTSSLPHSGSDANTVPVAESDTTNVCVPISVSSKSLTVQCAGRCRPNGFQGIVTGEHERDATRSASPPSSSGGSVGSCDTLTEHI